MKPKIPRKIDFGLVVIKIIFVSIAEMRELAECESDEIAPDGLWNPENETIYIRKRLHPAHRRDVFWHELKHMVNDVDYWSRYG